MKNASPDKVIAAFYEAAVDRQRWRVALERLATLADADAAVYFLHDSTTNGTLAAHSVGAITSEWLQSYREYYQPLDLARRVLERLPAGEMRPMHRYIEDAQIERSEYYQDFYIAAGLRYSCGGTQVFDGRRGIIAVHRARGSHPFDENCVRGLQAVLDQLPSINRVHELAARAAGEGSLCTAVLAALPRAVFVLDKQLRVHFLNAAAEALMDAAIGLHVESDMLKTGDSALTSALERQARRLCRDVPEAAGPPQYRLDNSGRALLEFQLTPLSAGLGHEMQSQPLALLSVRRTFHFPKWNSERPLGLTEAEFRLVAALVEGMTPEEYASRRRLALSTVRVHIRNALRKTGTRRTCELIALFAPLTASADANLRTAKTTSNG